MNIYDSINIFSEKDLSVDYRKYVEGLLSKGKKQSSTLSAYFLCFLLSKSEAGLKYKQIYQLTTGLET